MARVTRLARTSAREQGDDDRADVLLTDALRVFDWAEDVVGAAQALDDLGWIALYRNDYARAEKLHGENLARFRAIGDVDGVNDELGNLGLAALKWGDGRHAGPLRAEARRSARDQRSTGPRRRTAKPRLGGAARSRSPARTGPLLGGTRNLSRRHRSAEHPANPPSHRRRRRSARPGNGADRPNRPRDGLGRSERQAPARLSSQGTGRPGNRQRMVRGGRPISEAVAASRDACGDLNSPAYRPR